MTRNGKPELKDGWLRIANELQEAISRAKFTAYEHSLIDLIIRLSYGCKKSLYADLLHWSDMEVVGIPKQKARITAEGLRNKKVIKITYPENCIRLRLNKYYSEWNLVFADKKQTYDKLILLNLNRHKWLQENGNLQVTMNEKSNLQVTSGDDGNLQVTEKVTYRLPKSNLQVTEAGSKPALSLGLQAPKEKKESNKEKGPVITGNIVIKREPEIDGKNEAAVRDIEKEKSRKASKQIEALQDLVMATFHPQITSPPAYSACNSAIHAHGFDVLKQAADEVKGKALKSPTPGSALNFILGCAKRLKTPGIDYAKRNEISDRIKSLELLLVDFENETDETKFQGIMIPTATGPETVNTRAEAIAGLETEIKRLKTMRGG